MMIQAAAQQEGVPGSKKAAGVYRRAGYSAKTNAAIRSHVDFLLTRSDANCHFP
jgi:hypothetical protein